jgi:hypothetical protein
MSDPATVTSSARDLVEPAILRRCGHCGYDLHGLPPEGRCPECGQPFARDEIILFGWGAGASANERNARGAQGAVLLIGGAAWVGFGIFAIGRSGLQPDVLIVLAVVGGLFAVSLLRRHSAIQACGAPAQLRLSPRGYGLREGPGNVALQPWSEEVRATLGAVAPGRYRLLIKRTRYLANFRFMPWSIEETGFEFDAAAAAAEQVRAALERWTRVPV